MSAQTVEGQVSWIDQQAVSIFVDNLISSYYALVTQHYGYYPNSSVLNNFRLYHAVGFNYNVTVMRWSANRTNFAGIVFNLVVASSPTIRYNDSYLQDLLFPRQLDFDFIAKFPPNNDLGFAFRQGSGGGTNGTTVLPFIYVANLTTDLPNPMTTSAVVASDEFQGDQRAMTGAPAPNPINSLGSAIRSIPVIADYWWLLVILAGAVYFVIFQLIPMWFGSMERFIERIRGEGKQDKDIKKMDEVFKRNVKKQEKKKKSDTSEKDS